MDGTRVRHEYSVEITDSPGEYLVYFEYEPLSSAPDRGDRVCFLFSGFQTPIEAMIPIMMELTKVGYHVVMGDFRGQGRSGGELPIDWTLLIRDFDLIYGDVFKRHPDWNSTHISIVGHSMAGFAVLNFGKNREQVFTTVAIAPASYPENVNTTAPKNLLIINGQYDQAFTLKDTLRLFQRAVPDGEPGILYGDPLKGTAKQYLIQPKGRHETECFSDFVISHVVTFIEMGYGFLKPGDLHESYQEERMDYVIYGLLIGSLAFTVLVLWMEEIPSLKKIAPIANRENSANNEKNTQNINKSGPGTTELYPPIEPDKNPKEFHTFNFVKIYFKFIPEGYIISTALFILAILTMKNLYAHLQIALMGQSGFTSLFLFKYLYERQINRDLIEELGEKAYKDPRFRKITWNEIFKRYKELLRHDISWRCLVKALFYTAIFMGIVIFSLGNIFTMPVPMNKRAYQLFFFIPYIFMCYLFQIPVFLHYLTDTFTRKYPGPLQIDVDRNPLFKSLLAIILGKFGFFYLIGIFLFLIGNYMITIIFLLTILDIALTMLIVFNYYHNGTYMSLIIFGAITISLMYLGFSGILNGWNALFGHPNIFTWLR